MDTLPKIDRAMLRAKMLAEFERTLDAVAEAIDRAPPGRVIADSEEPARVALDRFREVAYETAMQVKINAAEAAFSPSAQCERPAPAS